MASSGVNFAYVMLICTVVLVVANAPPRAEAAIVGDQLATTLSSCLGYVQGSGGATPPQACCDGVKSLNTAANTTSDRKATFKCLVKLIGKFKGINDSLACGLPSNCGVTIPFRIGKSTDCKKVQ